MACSTAKASCKQLLTNNCDTETETRRQTDRQRLFRTAVPAVKEKLVLKWMMAAYLAKQESAAWSTPDCSARTQTCAVLSSAPPPDACMNICHIDLPGVRYSCSELIVRHLSLQPHAHWRDARQCGFSVACSQCKLVDRMIQWLVQYVVNHMHLVQLLRSSSRGDRSYKA